VLCGSMAGCLTCTMAGCTSCDAIFGFSLNPSSQLCECNVGYYVNSMNVCAQCTQLACLACTSLTNCSACTAEFRLNAGTCEEVCGDGVLYTLACDDGNAIDGDGCSSTCEI
jgi:cysteine-rich repeat protein